MSNTPSAIDSPPGRTRLAVVGVAGRIATEFGRCVGGELFDHVAQFELVQPCCREEGGAVGGAEQIAGDRAGRVAVARVIDARRTASANLLALAAQAIEIASASSPTRPLVSAAIAQPRSKRRAGSQVTKRAGAVRMTSPQHLESLIGSSGVPSAPAVRAARHVLPGGSPMVQLGDDGTRRRSR
jgi:hypothetical protein